MQPEEWRGTPRVNLDAQGPSRVFQPLVVPGPEFRGIRPAGTELTASIPSRPGGALLIFGATPREKSGAVVLQFLLDDAEVGRLTLQPPEAGFGSLYVANFRLAETAVPASEPGVFRILTIAGEQWRGNLVLVPDPSRFDALRVLIPVLAALLLAGAPFVLGRGPRWLIPLLVPLILLVVYGFTFFPWTVAPTDGLLFGDSWSYATGSLGWSGTSYMDRHPLFLPIMRRMVILLFRTRFGEIAVLQLAFALVAAANGLLAYLVFRRWLRDPRAASALLVVYAFSFSIWTYSSMYESYVFSAAVLNVFLLILPRWDQPIHPAREIAAWVCLVLAGLAFPPLLAMLGVLLARVFLWRAPLSRRLAAAAATLLVIPVAFLLGQSILRAAFSDGAVITPAGNANAGVVGENLAVVDRYAQSAYFTATQLANVLASQFIYAIGGMPYPLEWAQTWNGMGGYAASLQGASFLLGWTMLLTGAVYSVWRHRVFRRQALAIGALAFLPYLGFLWYFNPAEVLLYSAPLTSMILLGVALAWRTLLAPRWLPVVLLAMAVLVVLNNLPAVSSYV